MEYIFRLSYYTKRWNSETTLNLRKTETGWHISNIAINGDSDKGGTPYLQSNLNQDYVKYPHGIEGFLGYVWDRLDTGEIDNERAQDMLHEIGEWISASESSQPKWQGWN